MSFNLNAKKISLLFLFLCASALTAFADVAPVEVRVRQTPTGPRVFVDGKPVRSRFYYGSPANLCNIGWTWATQFNVPFRAVEDTDFGRVELPLYAGEKPIDFYDADLIDLTTSTTNFLGGRIRTDRYVCDNLKLRKDHVYRFRVYNKADHDRTYFHYKMTYRRADGSRAELPMPYGDTLGDTVALAAKEGVNLVTFSTDNSWGCEDWWNEASDERGFKRLDDLCERLIAINPKILLIPRIVGNAPDWFLEKHPESRMKFDRDYKVAMVSVSYRPYRTAVCEMVEKLTRHLQRKFPRNFAGLHIGGQNSAEWFYFNSMSGDLSGYDVATREAFGVEVPSSVARRTIRPNKKLDPIGDKRLRDFVAFRQIEIASLLKDLGAAIRRGSDGKCLALFFYGYTWELASNRFGSGELGHNAMEWLQREGREMVDGFSGPFSYNDRNLTGSASVMSAAESCLRKGFLWINEEDARTCREEFWDFHSSQFTPHADLWTTEQILLRDSIAGILRGYGEWWMDLFGRGWHRDAEMWKVRARLNPLDDAFFNRTRPYEPEIAAVMDDASLILNSTKSNEFMTYLRRREGYARSGGTYGQYFFEDFMSAPPASVKLVYLLSCDLTGERAAKLAAYKATHPNAVIVEATPADMTADAIAAHAKNAGVHLYTAPNGAYVDAAEGYVMVQARQDGPLAIDFGAAGEIVDGFTGARVGQGPKLAISFRKGEVRLFKSVRMRRLPVTCAPFPDALSAYVWRNWFCVPHERLASVIGSDEAAIARIGAEMGLPANPAVLPDWHRRGYITVVRRNWHLVPRAQLLKTIDMSAEEFEFRLREDDFLWSKLGRVNPSCATLAWSEAAEASGRAARQTLAATLKAEGADDFTEEPRFTFVNRLSSVDPRFTAPPKSADNSPFDFRLIFSYFADYADPLADPEVGSYPEGLLQKLAAQGVNAVWLHSVLRTLAKDPKYPEFGEGCENRLANLQTLVNRCAKYGIRVYLYVNEPRSQPAAFFGKPGRAGLRGAKGNDETWTMCTSVPEVRRWVHDSLAQVFSSVKGLGGVFTITMSENLTHCDSRNFKNRCPRCKGRPTGDIIAEINRTIIDGMHAGDPNAEALVWNWQWPKDEELSIIDRLPKKGVRLMAVSENAIKFTRGGVEAEEFDYSISVVGPGENARKIWGGAAKNGLGSVAKVQASNSWELSPFPYLPVMDLVAEHADNLAKAGVSGVMLSWSCGCCPAPNLSIFRDYRTGDGSPEPVLNRLATALYGADKAPRARKAWTAFSEGFREYPFHVITAYFGPQHWGPANPLYLKPTGYPASMVGFPYDSFANKEAAKWNAVYPPEVWIAQMQKVADGFARGVRLMKGVAQAKELAMYRAEGLHFQSAVDQASFILARNRGDRPEMMKFVRRELATAKEYLPIIRADSRIGYECSNHYFAIPQDIREKILLCRQIVDEGPLGKAGRFW